VAKAYSQGREPLDQDIVTIFVSPVRGGTSADPAEELNGTGLLCRKPAIFIVS